MCQKKKRIILWGAGYYAGFVLRKINRQTCEIIAIVDSSNKKQGKKWEEEFVIKTPGQIVYLEYDLIVITAKDKRSISETISNFDVSEDKIIHYWDSLDNEIFLDDEVVALNNWKEIDKLKKYIESLFYEYGTEKCPYIKSGEALLEKMIVDKTSLVRFGDGEFEIIQNRDRPWFQKVDNMLAERLRNVLRSDDPIVNIAIAQDFQCLDQYKDECADIIRDYMSSGTRAEIVDLLDMNKTYYDAYVSRPYIIYKNTNKADKIFPLFKKLWRKRDICVVEGKYNRFGIGNDLLNDVKSVIRVACPEKNAWSRYEDILNYIIENVEKEVLILISLGPTATILAYDLAQKGYQAIDIGQLDNEYDWYLMRAESRIPIKGKMVAEFVEEKDNDFCEDYEKQYRKELVKEIV